MDKKFKTIGTIGHIGHGKTTTAIASTISNVFIISDPMEDARREFLKNKHWRDKVFIQDNYNEYQLILQKKSKLSAMKRKEILERFKH